MNELIIKILAGTGAVVLVIALSALLAYPYMILWNQCLVPAIPALKEVEWLQMWAITILAHGLFKSSK